jgi:cobalt-zinc-cadmium efflux system outer membrane protein
VLIVSRIRIQVLAEIAGAFLIVFGNQCRIQILDEKVAEIDRITALPQQRVAAGTSSVGEIAGGGASAFAMADRERVRSLLATSRRGLAVLMRKPAQGTSLRR